VENHTKTGHRLRRIQASTACNEMRISFMAIGYELRLEWTDKQHPAEVAKGANGTVSCVGHLENHIKWA